MQRTRRVLVVDDSDANRETLAEMVEAIGYDVLEARDGREALDRCRDADLALLDLIMPVMDGIQVLEQWKADEELRHLPVIMLSGLSEMETMARCIELGADDYLPRPYNPVLLRARISACMEKKRLRDQEVALFRQLEEGYRRLRELEDLRDSLTHMIVHDMRTPLTGILAGLDTLESFGDLNPEQREFLRMAENSGRTLLGMINDLLDVSKMEAGSLTLTCEEVALPELLAEACLQVAPIARGKGLALTQEPEAGLPALYADREKLLRVLVNLLGNAVKFTPPGGQVSLSVRTEAADMIFAVRDTGAGIPEEAFERIFEKFGQVENRRSQGVVSTGLGLTFCKMAVEAHGGRIWVQSTPGEGSTFRFSLPLHAPQNVSR